MSGMFSWLRLEHFGKFDNLEVELGQTTLVTGGNETGKTTLFDGFFAGLCEPAEASSEREALESRYGRAASAQLGGEGEQPTLQPSEYLVLHGAREGGLTFGPDAARGTAHATELEQRLQAATSTPSTIASELEILASDDPEQPASLELQGLRGRLRAIEEERDRAWLARTEILADEIQATELSIQLGKLDTTIGEREAELGELEGQLEQKRELWRCHLRVVELEARLGPPADHRGDHDELAALGEIDSELVTEFEKLASDVDVHRAKIDTIENRRAGSHTRMQQVVCEIAQARLEEPLVRRAAGRAAATKLRLERFMAEPKRIERPQKRSSRVVAACLFIVAGVTAATALSEVVPYLSLGLGMALGGLTLTLGRRTVHEDEPNAELAFVAGLRDEWNRDPDLPQTQAGTAQELAAFCDERARAYLQLTATLEDQVGYKHRVEEQTGQILERSRGMLESTLRTREESLAEWLRAVGSNSREAFAEKVGRQRELEARIADRVASGVAPPTYQECVDLERVLHRELDDLGQPDCAPELETEIAELATDLAGVHSQNHEMCEERTRLARERDELVTRVESELGTLATRIHHVETERLQLETRIGEREAEKHAAKVAHQLFSELAGLEGLHFRVLSDAAALLLEAAGLPLERVEITGLDETQVRVEDPSGRLRSVTQLSKGMRDLVILAARLALAGIAADGPELLVLEEPFASLDDERTACGLRMLRAFQERTGWQLVLLSRNERLRDDIANYFDDPVIVDLGRGEPHPHQPA